MINGVGAVCWKRKKAEATAVYNILISGIIIYILYLIGLQV
ncbi:hypothetical protein BMS3Abin16_01509 [archaeon BMS3Abin16]|nr:hypothetical protein BMS3Abin16_01509 [archaeon BMS3Abin16]